MNADLALVQICILQSYHEKLGTIFSLWQEVRIIEFCSSLLSLCHIGLCVCYMFFLQLIVFLAASAIVFGT